MSDNKVKNTNENKIKKTLNRHVYKKYIGLIFFLMVFVYFIPNILMYLNIKNTLGLIPLYLANLDLIATSFNVDNEPIFLKEYLGDLYNLRTYDDYFHSYLSFNIISLISLVSVFIFVLKKTQHLKFDTIIKKHSYMISIFSLMICITYLLPNRYIKIIQDYIFSILINHLSQYVSWIIIALLGLLLSFVVIYAENLLSKSILNKTLIQTFERSRVHTLFSHVYFN